MTFSKTRFSPAIAQLIFAGVLLIRLVALLRLTDSPLLLPSHGDMVFYNDWANRILHGASEHLAFYGLPGYAYALAAIYRLVGFNPFVPGLLQACADAGTSVLLYKIAVRLFGNAPRGKSIGVLAALGWALFEPAQAYSVILMPTALSVFAFWFLVWQIIKRDELPRFSFFLVLGIFIGLSATAVATILFLLPLLLLACLFKWRASPTVRQFWARRSLAAALLFLGVAFGTSPCWIHNCFYARDPVFLSAHSGVNFWIGNNPGATGYPNFPPGLRAGQESMLRDSVTVAEKAAGHSLPRSQVSAYWSSQAANFIRQHFGDWLRLLARKIANFWNAFQYDDLSVITILREEHVTLPGPSFGIVAALALGGSVFALASNPAAIWVIGAIFFHLCALLPVFVTERYRLAAVPGLLILAAAGLYSFCGFCRRFQLAPLTGYATALALATMLVSVPREDASLWALDAYNSGIVALDLHRYPLAETKLDLAYRYAPENAEVNFAVGNLRLAQGNKPEAKIFYRQAVTLDPGNERAWNNLGVLALSEERWRLAEQFFARALQQDSQDANTHFLMAKSLVGEGNHAAARAQLNAALTLKPDQPEFIAFDKELAMAEPR